MAEDNTSPSSAKVAQASPIKANTYTNSAAYSTCPDPPVEKLQRAYRHEMDGKVVLVSFKEFMDFFMSEPDIPPLPEHFAASLGLESIPVKPESAMYPPLMEKLNTAGFAPGYRFVATPHRSDPNDSSGLRVDGGMYLDKEYPEDGQHTSWSRIELLIECKTGDVTGDPFDDTMESGEPNSDERRKVLGQVMSYACRVFKRQHRTHQFTLMMLGSSARIIRWDRSGVVATKKFNYMEEPEKLVGFIWVLARLPAEKRGIDPTVTRVEKNSEDWQLMQDRSKQKRLLGGKFAVQEHAREAFKASLNNSELWKIRVDAQPPSDGSESETVITSRYFLVGEPTFMSDGLSGRGTRGYVAIDLSDPEGPFVFLKDVWRVDHVGIRKEGEILGYLNGRDVQNIPTKICDGDVDPLSPQTTVSQKIWKKKHPGDEDKCPLKTHTHYRLVVREIGLPMDQFENGRELIYLVSKCIGAHRGAYLQGIIHRDISCGNVLIGVKEYVDAKGNFKRERDDMSDVPRQQNRTGTWQFLSVNVLRDPKKKVTVEDELESFFHLVLYYAIRYLPHNCSDVAGWMYGYFDGFTYMDEEYFGGKAKSDTISSGVLDAGGKPLKFYTSPPREGFPEPPAHPINQYFRQQLLAFQAYNTLYRVDHDMIQPAAPNLDSTTEGSNEDSEGERSAADWFSSFTSGQETTPNEPTTLTDAEREVLEMRCEILRDHRSMIIHYGHIWKLLAKPPLHEKIADQMSKDYRPDKDAKKPKVPKSKKDSKTGESVLEPSPESRTGLPSTSASGPTVPRIPNVSQTGRGMSQGASGAMKTRKKRGALHDGEPFEAPPSAKRSASGA
ncbi:hypothetical protein C8Q79DRAFT_927439 [Trametes meyenii]|nr:hypothetical protein C8Q79DRAFT_927439 [Trametes meyenii]